MTRELVGTIKETEGNLWVGGEVDEKFDDVLAQIGLGNEVVVLVREHSGRMVAELCIDVGGGQVVVTPNNTFEFHDCLPISIDDMKYVIEEAEAFVAYRDGRNALKRRHDHQ